MLSNTSAGGTCIIRSQSAARSASHAFTGVEGSRCAHCTRPAELNTTSRITASRQ